MADRRLRYVLEGQDKSAGKTLEGTATKSEQAGKRIGSAFSKAGQLIGGEAGEALTKISEAIDEVGGKTHKLEAVGAGLAGVGAVLTGIGDQERQAQQQLANAIDNTGNSIDDFDKQIEESIHHMEKYGYTAATTQQALQTLVNATHDPQKAIDLLGETADLAASKHKSLASAATDIARVIGGKGSRTLAQYNVQLIKNVDGTTNWNETNVRLAQILSGQADASVAGFTGKLRGLKAEVQDQVALFGEKYGPAITASGIAILAFGPYVAKGIGFLRGFSLAETAAAAATVTANEEIAASSTATAAEVNAAISAQLAAYAEAGAGAQGEANSIVAANSRIATSSRTAAAATSRSWLGAGVAAGGLTAGLVATGVALSTIGDRGETTTFMKNLTDQFTYATHSTDMSAKALLEWADSDKAVGYAGDILRPALKDLGVSVDDIATAVSGTDEQYQQFLDTLKEHNKLSGDAKTVLDELHGSYKNTGTAADSLAASGEKNATALSHQAAQGLKLKDALTQAADAFDRLNHRTLDALDAKLAFRDAEAAVTDAVKQNGKSLDEDTRKGRANLESISDAIKAAQDHSQAILQRTGSSRKATKAYREDIAALKAHLIALGLDGKEIDRLIARYGRIPKLKPTRLDVRTREAHREIDNLQRKIDAIKQGKVPGLNADSGLGRRVIADFQREINGIQDKTIHVGVKDDASNRLRNIVTTMQTIGQGVDAVINITTTNIKTGTRHTVRAQASGTDSAPPGWSWVGERMPNGAWSPSAELVNFRGGEQVLSARDARRFAREYANGTVELAAGGQRGSSGWRELKITRDSANALRFWMRDEIDNALGFESTIGDMR
jgi:hypothetical protein